MKRVGIIGGGASGMMAAIAAAEQKAQVTILERQPRIGKKLLATGNGKCNLSNLSFEVYRDYHSGGLDRLPAFFDRFGVQDTVSFFARCGMLVTDRQGYLYPRSGQASTVLDTLRERLEAERVQAVCDCHVQGIFRRGGSFQVATDQGRFSFDALILACGSPAGTREGEGLGGTALAKSLGLESDKMLPALAALRCGGDFLKSLAGVRCQAAVTLQVTGWDGRRERWREQGELQLVDYGISGIPVFQLSRHASLALDRGSRVEALLDFLPEYPLATWQSFCHQQFVNAQGRRADAFLEGMLHKKVAQVLLKRAGVRPDTRLSASAEKQMNQVFSLMRAFPVKVTGINPPEKAQVCLGGVWLSQVDEGLQAKKVPGLYLAGEVLDVDGRCGGYNLQWAWTSGYIAGTAAGMETK